MENKIFCKMKAFLVVLAVLCVYPCCGELMSLAPKALKKINSKTSIDILNQIVETINATVKEQKKLNLACETDINKTIASCETCAADLCQQQPPPLHEQIFIGLVSEVKKPLTTAAKLVTNIGSHLNVFKHLDIGFLGKLSGVTDTLKNTLLGGAEQAFSGVISGLEETSKTLAVEAGKAVLSVGKGFGKFGTGIGKFAGKIGFGIGGVAGHLGNGFGDLLGNVGGGVIDIGEKVGKQLGNVGKGFSDAGKSIGNAFSSIFGKRSTRHILHKRCVKSCPVCETLDTKKHSQEKIVEKVCGRTFVSKQKKAQDTLKTLEEVYNYILKENPVVTKFEFDTTSIDFDNGSVIFKKSFVTFQAGKIGKRFRFPWRFNAADIDAMAVKISKEVRKNIIF